MNCALIVAAGMGTRMGISGGKQFLLLMGKPALAHTLAAFQKASSIDNIVIVTVSDNIAHCRVLATEYGITKVKHIVEGGKERMDSVYNGLNAVRRFDGVKNVVIHDGARPLIVSQLIDKVTAGLIDCDGAVLGIPAVDTIKLVRDYVVVDTLNRAETWQIQTPQVFKIDSIIEAHEVARASGLFGTDDSFLVEHNGGLVKIVTGSRENLKITTPEDLILAEAILRTREAL